MTYNHLSKEAIQGLPKDVRQELEIYIDRLKNINWFRPSKKLSKKTVDAQIETLLQAFGIKADVEYRRLYTQNEWSAAWQAYVLPVEDTFFEAIKAADKICRRAASWEKAYDNAHNVAWNTSNDVWDVTQQNQLAFMVAAATAAAFGVADLLAGKSGDKEYIQKYPHGNFLQFIPLWEMGLYPAGIGKSLSGKKNNVFVCYVPLTKKNRNALQEFFKEGIPT
jgi:hypothetical protein